jgi:diguanylate cyclase (GGDEF)-like protein
LERPYSRYFPTLVWAAASLRDLGALLISPTAHATHVQQQISALLSRRLKLVAALWCLFSVAWLPIDLLVLPVRLWPEFAGVRVASIIAFGLLARLSHTYDLSLSRRRLAFFFAIQALCALPAISLGGEHGSAWQEVALRSAYDDLPFVLITAIGLFPLFLVDAVLAFAGMLLAALAIAATQHVRGFEPFDFGDFWLLGQVGTLAALASAAQMEAVLQLVARVARDLLTGALPRPVGEEVLAVEIGVALRHNSALSVVFLDLDRFKLVNDGFGHDAGDALLRDVADRLRGALRRQDSLIRWGGEEFLIVLPMTDAQGTRQVLARLSESGIGHRPDGVAQTASLGVAELAEISGQPDAGWQELVMIADQRMYAAKKAGRNCVVTRDQRIAFLPRPEAAK